MNEVKLADWVELGNRFEGEIRDICEACYEYTKTRNQLLGGYSELEIEHVSKLKELGLKVRKKYLKIMSSGGEALLKTKEEELNKDLSLFYEFKGEDVILRNLFPELVDAKQKGELRGFVSELFSQFDGFVESIYYDMKEVLREADKTMFPKLYADAVLKRIRMDREALRIA